MPVSTKSSSLSTSLDETWPVYRYTQQSSSRGAKYFYYYIPPSSQDAQGWRISFFKSHSHEQPIKVEALALEKKDDMPGKQETHFLFHIHEKDRPGLLSAIRELQDTWHSKDRTLKGHRRPKAVRYPQTCLLSQYTDLLDSQTQDMHLQFLSFLKDKKILSGGAPYTDAKRWFKTQYRAEVGLAKKSAKPQSPRTDKDKHRYRVVDAFKRMGWLKREYTPTASTAAL